jgi:hypothetical protein
MRSLFILIVSILISSCTPGVQSVSTLKDIDCAGLVIQPGQPPAVCNGSIVYIDPKTGQLKFSNLVATVTQQAAQDMTKDEIVYAAVAPYLPPLADGLYKAAIKKNYRDACEKERGEIAVKEAEVKKLTADTNVLLATANTELPRLENSASQNGFGLRENHASELASFEQASKEQLASLAQQLPPPSDILDVGQTPGQQFPEQAKVERGQALIDNAEAKIGAFRGQSDFETRRGLLALAKEAMGAARLSYRNGQVAQGDYFYNIAVAAADITMSIAPVFGWGKDFYEARYGINALTGKELTKFERTMAWVGVVTAGIGSKVVLAVKLGAFIKIGKNGLQELAEAEKFIRAAESLGLRNTSEIKAFSDVADKMGKSAEELADAIKTGVGKSGQDFEQHLMKKLGGEPPFKVSNSRGTREFDGRVGKAWYEAKTGWEDLNLEKFKSDMGKGLSISSDEGASYHLLTNSTIPVDLQEWLTKKGITFVHYTEVPK